MRGRPGCPTGQKKNSVEATGGRAPFFYKERLGTKSPPHPPQCAHWGTFPPRGRLWVEKNPASQTSGPRKGRNKIQSVFCTDTRRAKNSSHPESASFAGAVRGASPNFGSPAQRVPKFLPFPARPAGGRAVTGFGSWAAGQAKKEGGPPQGPPKLEKVGPGRKNLFLPGVLSSGFLPKKAGPPPGAGRATGRCAPRAASEPPTRRVRSTAPACQAPHQTGALFFCAILCNFFAPTVYAGVQLWPRFPRG